METQTGRKQALATSQRNRILIAANPTAGARAIDSPIDRLAAAITNAGFEPTRHHDLGQFAVDAAAARESDQLHAVIAAGGDGTASAVANRIAPDVPLLVFPLGTENLLARYLGIRADPAQACDILRTGDKLQMDAGLANGRMFLLMASCGFDAEVVRRVHQRRRGHITRLSYVQPTLESLHEYPHPDIRVYCDAAADDATNPQVLGKWVFVMNVPMYAGGMPIVGRAHGADGRMDVCVFKRGSAFHNLVYLSGMFLRQHENWSDCDIREAQRCLLESDEPVPYQLDGDFVGHLPVDIEVAPLRVMYFVPSNQSMK